MDPFVITVCVLFALALVGYVFVMPGEVSSGPEKGRLAFLRERKEVLYENLRDLNFEHKAGKLSEADFESLRSSLEAEASSLLAEIAVLEKIRVILSGRALSLPKERESKDLRERLSRVGLVRRTSPR